MGRTPFSAPLRSSALPVGEELDNFSMDHCKVRRAAVTTAGGLFEAERVYTLEMYIWGTSRRLGQLMPALGDSQVPELFLFHRHILVGIWDVP